jgi:hypothetical protein
MALRKVEKTAEQVANENSFASIAVSGWNTGGTGRALATWTQHGGDSIPTFCQVWERSK